MSDTTATVPPDAIAVEPTKAYVVMRVEDAQPIAATTDMARALDLVCALLAEQADRSTQARHSYHVVTVTAG